MKSETQNSQSIDQIQTQTPATKDAKRWSKKSIKQIKNFNHIRSEMWIQSPTDSYKLDIIKP